MHRIFTSDNVTPACDAIMAAIAAANVGAVSSYGADDYTHRLRRLANELFETEVAIFPVATGTAANSLALAQVSPPYGAIYCYEAAHVVTDEGGAPEFFTGGAKLIGFPATDGKIAPQQLRDAVAFAAGIGIHHVKPSAVSLTQSTEWGTVYAVSEVAAIKQVAEEFHLPMHMDGARFANALVHLGCSPAEATWKSGVDVLSLGATKNGALCAEAVVFFDPQRAQDFDRRCKRAGHVWSKSRFLSVQMLAYLSDDLWLRNARQANSMAAALARGLGAIAGVGLLQRVDANEVFLQLSASCVAALEAAGFKFYRWPSPVNASGIAIRLVTSYLTRSEDIDDFLTQLARVAGA